MARLNKRLFKRFFWISSLFIVAFIAIGVSLAYLYEDDVKKFAISKINKQIQTKIKVTEIELSFIKRFPMAALQFKGVEVMEVVKAGEASSLLSAENIFLKFNIIDLIQNNMVLKNVEIEGAKLNLIIYEDGSDNFHIQKDTKKKEGDFLLELAKVSLKNSSVHYKNYASKQELDLEVNKISLSGIFSKEKFDINMSGATLVRKYISEGYAMLTNKSLDMDFDIGIHPDKHQFIIRKGNIIYNLIPFSISGNIENPKEGIQVDLQFKAPALSVVQVLKTLPPIYQMKFNDYDLQGVIGVNAHINGVIVSRKVPHIEINFQLSDAEIIQKTTQTKLRDINLQAKYSNGNEQSLYTSSIHFSNFSFFLNSSEFKGRFQLVNFVNSKLQMQLESSLQLEEMLKFTGKVGGLEKLSGKANLKLKIGGVLKNLVGANDIDFSDLSYQADLNLQEVSLKHSQSDLYYEKMVGDISIDQNIIQIHPTIVYVNNNPQNISAKIWNYQAWFNNPTAANPLYIRADADLSSISFDEIKQMLSGDNEGDGSFPDDLDIKMGLKADTFIWDNIVANQVKGNLSLRNQNLDFTNLSFNTFNGQVSGDCSIGGQNWESHPMLCKGKLNNVEITPLFQAFNNFGQNVVTEKNIKGDLSSNFAFNARFNKSWELQTKSVILDSEIIINNGELIDIKELNALSSYTRIDDFSHIKFSQLKNNIQIKDEKIVIPDMTISSNKMDLDLTGAHDFDNSYDYHIGVLMSDVLYKKAKEESENEFGDVQSDGYGKTKLFFHVFGKGDEMHVKIDRKGLSKKLKNDMQEEGQSLKSALNKEFGWFKETKETESKNDSIKNKKEESKENLKKQEEGEFIFEWDDEEEEATDPPE